MKVTIFLGLGLWAFNALAVPSAFTSKCGAIDVENTTSSTLLRDHDDCGVIWVLPPSAGTIKLSGLEPSANLGMCQELKDIQASSRYVVGEVKKLSKKISELEPEYQAAEAVLELAMHDLAEVKRLAEYQDIRAKEDEIAEIEDRIEALIGQLESCQNNCDALETEFKEKRKERRLAKKELRQLKREYREIVRRAEKAEAKVEAARFGLENVGAEITKMLGKQTELRNTLQSWLFHFSKLEGGKAFVDYNSGWSDNVRELERRYSGRYTFKEVDTKDARIFVNLIGSGDQETYLSSMPSVLDYSINGHKYVPWGEERPVEQSALPSHIGGSLRLSMIGGCPAYYKNFLEQDTHMIPNDSVESRYDYAISASYKYPAAFKLKMTASYNLFKFYERISQSTTRGGFFSRKTYNTVMENKIDRDSFSIDWDVEDPDSEFDLAKRQEVEKSLKHELMGRVLNTMARPITTNPVNVTVNQITPPASGAIILAQGLNQTCGYWSLWCSGTSWVLKTLDAVFGSSTAVATFQSTHDRTATETWNVSEAKWRTGTTGFSGKSR